MWEFLSSGFSELLTTVDGIRPEYIYLILFAVAFIENIFPPFPGDTFTLIGGYLAATGRLDVWLTLVIVTAGTVASIMLVYYFGYHHGRDYFMRKRFRLFGASDIGKVDGWFDRYGVWTLICSRFLIGGRVGIAIASGISRYPTGKMVVFSSISSLLFGGMLVALAYFMHAYIGKVAGGFELYSKIILAVVGLMVILWIIVWIRRLKNAKKET